MALPSGLAGLGRHFKPPPDILDAYANWALWQKTFKQSLGCLLLVVGLKFPVARRCFHAAYRKNASTYRSEPERVFRSLADTAQCFGDGTAQSAALRAEIDSIKGPLKVHGLSVYLRKLHVTRPTKTGPGKGAQRSQNPDLSCLNAQRRVPIYSPAGWGLDLCLNPWLSGRLSSAQKVCPNVSEAR